MGHDRGGGGVSANLATARVALDAVRALLHTSRMAVIDEPRKWSEIPVGKEHTGEFLTVLWTQQVFRVVRQHLALLSRFAADAAYLASTGDHERLEMLVRTGPSHWGEHPEVIAAADAAWERGEGVRLGDKR